jgi:Rps23 Pro-64 3,4-dihydroxylase Tpa1-like proline 4-hydroxylase
MEDIQVIKNFLHINHAEALLEVIKSYEPEEWYCMYQGDKYPSCVFFLDNDENSKTIEKEFLRLEDVFDSSIHGFRFKKYYRSSDENDFMYKFVRSDIFINKLKDVVKKDTIKIKSSFVSKYEDSDYAGMHKDTARGQYSFTYQLTKNWNPNHGGFLSFWDSETFTIYKTIYPEFNSITVFKVQPHHDPDHFVTRVCGPGSRIAITGWFDAT